MLVKDAIAAQVRKIDEVKAQRELERVKKEEAAEAQRQQWIWAMRERLELQFGLELTSDDIAVWQVESMGSQGHYHLNWTLPEGSLSPDSHLSFEDVTPPGRDWQWSASYYGDYGRTYHNLGLIQALTYAATGKSL